MNSTGKKYDLEERFVDFAANASQFALSIIRRNEVTRYHAHQLIRSASSSALNFGEVLGANSARDYVHKASIVVKELKETRINLKIIARLNVNEKRVFDLLDETEQLVRITSSLIQKKKA